MRTIEALARDLADGRATARGLVEQCLDRIADPAGEGARAFRELFAAAAGIESVLGRR